MVVTRNGKALRFHERMVRAMGRTAAGVRAMRLLGDDQIVSLDVVKPGELFIFARAWLWQTGGAGRVQCQRAQYPRHVDNRPYPSRRSRPNCGCVLLST